MVKTKRKIKKWVITATLVAIGTLSTIIYYSYDSRTEEEIADYYSKEWAKLLNVNDEVAFNITLDKGEPKKLDSKYGTFLVKLKETRKYLDGYKITFSVENLSNIILRNPKVKIKWNRTINTYNFADIRDMPKEYYSYWNEKMQKEREDWSKSYKTKEFANLKNLPKGSWIDLEFIILPCSSEEFELVEFSIVG